MSNLSRHKSKRRSYYDRLASRIVSSAFSFWVNDFKNGQKESLYYDQIEEELEFDVYCDISFSGEGFSILDQTGADGRDEDDDGDYMTPFIQIAFSINPEWLPEWWPEIYYYLCDVIRHEIEHITQDGKDIGNYREGKPNGDDTFIRILIQNGIFTKSDYLKLPKEVDANVQGLRFESRKRRKPMINIVQNYLDTQGLSQEEKDDVLETWRQRAKKIGGIPSF